MVQALSAIPDQDTFYDITDVLEDQGMEQIIKYYMSQRCSDLDLLEQFQIYETVLKHEDGAGDGVIRADHIRSVCQEFVLFSQCLCVCVGECVLGFQLFIMSVSGVSPKVLVH